MSADDDRVPADEEVIDMYLIGLSQVVAEPVTDDLGIGMTGWYLLALSVGIQIPSEGGDPIMVPGSGQ